VLTTKNITGSSILMSKRIDRYGADTVSVLMDDQMPIWDVEIEEHPMSQTVVFEESHDWKTWAPVKGQRLSGPGPKFGTIVTNAVAGGPAHFRGRCSPGTVAFRVRCARWDGAAIDMHITTESQGITTRLPVRLVGGDGITFVIEEEKSLEDLLNEL